MIVSQTMHAKSFIGDHTDHFQRLNAMGFGRWIYSAVPNYHLRNKPQANRVSTYPAGFIESYNQLDFASVDPFTPYWLEHTNPASFRKVRRSVALNPKQKELMTLNADFDVNRGIAFPLTNVIGFKAVLALSFDGSLTELNSYIAAVEDELKNISRCCNEQFLRHHRATFLNSNAPQLTAQQKRVLGLLADGKLTKQIADILSISLNAVDKHIANIKITLSARTSVEATALALQWHII